MLEAIDLIVSPLTEMNPLKYIFSRSYRQSIRHSLGARARRIFIYQMAVLLLFLVGGSAALWLFLS